MDRQGPEINQETIGLWSKKQGITLEKEEISQMTKNIISFFDVLNEWDARSTVKKRGL